MLVNVIVIYSEEGDSKTIWQVAEEREENKGQNKEQSKGNTSYGNYRGWHKVAIVDSPTIATTLKVYLRVFLVFDQAYWWVSYVVP